MAEIRRFNVYCPNEEKKDLLKGKLRLAKGLTNTEFNYDVIVKGLDFLIHSIEIQKSKI